MPVPTQLLDDVDCQLEGFLSREFQFVDQCGWPTAPTLKTIHTASPWSSVAGGSYMIYSLFSDREAFLAYGTCLDLMV